jgi:hypothetical protein
MPDDTLRGDDFLKSVQAFVAEKWKSHNPCDRCGTFEWSILPGKETVLSLKALSARGFSSSTQYDVEFIPIYCNNCGNTVNVFMGTFMEWLTKNRQTT